MRRIRLLRPVFSGTLLLLLSSLAWGQGGYQVGVTQGIAVQSNGVGYVQVLPLASIRVCQDGATGTPCAPAATIYTDRTLGTPLGSNVVISDTGGNYAWFAPPGWYQEQISSPGQSTLTRPVLITPDGGSTNSSGTGLFLKQTSPTILAPAITGGGSWLGGPTINSPILITPTLGVATGTSLNLGGTGVLSTTAQSGTGSLCMTVGCAVTIQGVTDGSDAAAGKVGEFIRTKQVTPQALSNSVVLNIVSIALTAGDWDLEGNIVFSGTTTNATTLYAAIETTNNSVANDNSWDNMAGMELNGAAVANGLGLTVPVYRVSITTPTTYYLNTEGVFATNSLSAAGSLRARRVR